MILLFASRMDNKPNMLINIIKTPTIKKSPAPSSCGFVEVSERDVKCKLKGHLIERTVARETII